MWHTEVPTVAGVYAMDHVDSYQGRPNVWCAYWDGASWHQIDLQDEEGIKTSRLRSVSRLAVVWHHLISADTPPIADWRPGDQVPEGERKQGLWHCKMQKERGASVAIAGPAFNHRLLYRPAAPGVRAGEAYDEARYGVVG